MSSVCFYFQVHQPERLRRYRIFDIGSNIDYFDAGDDYKLSNEKIIRKVADKCYLPANKMLLDLLEKYPQFKVSFSISGSALDQFEKYTPEVLNSFKRLANTGRVEFIAETYYHSLSFLYSKEEFRYQVKRHKKKIREIFGLNPTVFRNTELIYNNEIAKEAKNMGFKAVLSEGADHILGWRSPNFIYHPAGLPEIKLLLKNYKLSDDIAFRFSSQSWSEYPLLASKFGQWISSHNGNGDIINLFMDYETLGEHQWEDTGIFKFMEGLPSEILKNPDNDFVTPSEAVLRYNSVSSLDVPNFISWADTERDLSAWLSNEMQEYALKSLYDLEEHISRIGDRSIIDDWRKMQTSDHFYYMCTKWFSDGDVHKYFNPYESPYEAFVNFMNVLHDLKMRIENILSEKEYIIPIQKSVDNKQTMTEKVLKTIRK